jgi:thioredoxin
MKLQLCSLLLVISTVFSYSQSATLRPSNSGSGTTTLTPDEFEKKMAAVPDVQLIDVRTPEEFKKGHLFKAVNIDFESREFEKQISTLDKSKPVFLYCISGGRSAEAAAVLFRDGFKETYVLLGGYLKWTKTAKPVFLSTDLPTNVGMSLDDFTKSVQSDQYVLVDFNATWCVPCKKMMPILDSLAEEKKDHLKLLKIDIDQNKELTHIKQIDNIPRLELYYKGKIVWTEEGYVDKAYILKETNL